MQLVARFRRLLVVRDYFHEDAAWHLEEAMEGLDRLATEDLLDRGRSTRWLRVCLGELRPAERQAIVLAYHHGMSHGDLAEHLERPLGTVKAWIRRGLESLRRCLEQAGGGEAR